MTGIERRIKELEKRTATSEPVTINIRKTIIGMDGEVERETNKVIHLRGVGVQFYPPQ